MRILLDTHLMLWSQSDPKKLDRTIRSLLDRSDVFVSAASWWEVSIKSALGKLKVEPRDLLTAVESSGFLPLPITAEHAVRVHDLNAAHPDPFDRLLVAQASCERMTLLTHDASLQQFGVVVRVI